MANEDCIGVTLAMLCTLSLPAFFIGLPYAEREYKASQGAKCPLLYDSWDVFPDALQPLENNSLALKRCIGSDDECVGFSYFFKCDETGKTQQDWLDECLIDRHKLIAKLRKNKNFLQRLLPFVQDKCVHLRAYDNELVRIKFDDIRKRADIPHPLRPLSFLCFSNSRTEAFFRCLIPTH